MLPQSKEEKGTRERLVLSVLQLMFWYLNNLMRINTCKKKKANHLYHGYLVFSIIKDNIIKIEDP